MTTPVRFGVRHVLDAQQRDVVIQFGAEVERLWATPVAGQGEKRVLLRMENHFDWSTAGPGRPPRIVGRTIQAPTDDELAALQRQVRVFVLENEPTHFPDRRNLVSRAFHDAGLDDPEGFLRHCKAEWKLPLTRLAHCPIEGQVLIDLWFNGELFHRDAVKKAKLDAVRTQAGDGLLRAWLMLAFAGAQAVLIAFHMFLRDRTDLYDDAPFAVRPKAANGQPET